jgi:hypothetical protein
VCPRSVVAAAAGGDFFDAEPNKLRLTKNFDITLTKIQPVT